MKEYQASKGTDSEILRVNMYHTIPDKRYSTILAGKKFQLLDN